MPPQFNDAEIVINDDGDTGHHRRPRNKKDLGLEDVGTIDDATTVSGGVDSLSERDEIKEVREYNKEDNRNVQLWKIALMTLLTAFGVAITYTTYTFLKQEERDSFEVAVSL